MGKIDWKAIQEESEQLDAEDRWEDAVQSQNEKRDFIYLYKENRRLHTWKGGLFLIIVLLLAAFIGWIKGSF